MIANDPKTEAEPRPGRLPVRVVIRLHRLLAGDARTERLVLDYIQAQWQGKNLFYLPPKVAEAIIDRPWDFLRAVKEHCEPVASRHGHFLTTEGI